MPRGWRALTREGLNGVARGCGEPLGAPSRAEGSVARLGLCPLFCMAKGHGCQ